MKESVPTTAGDAPLDRVHFIGAGGIGMSGIARILLARGATVSGSDAKENANITALRALGARVHIGHAAANLGQARTVVVSNAIPEHNPELREARRRGLAVVHRATALASVMAGRRGVAVAGTVGKTSTTSMLTVLARGCGTDPSYVIGGNLNESEPSNARQGGGELFIVEADESDSSFLRLSPDAAVVTNIGAEDHLDLHGSAENYARAFERFADRIAATGFLVAGADDAGANRLVRYARDKVRVRTFGESPTADLRLSDVAVTPDGTTYKAFLDGVPLPPVRIGVPGRHMALNSAAALLTALELGLPADRAVEGLASYRGVHRRFEYKGEAGGVRVYDDYANFPTKVREQLRAARVVAGPGRLIVAFQPSLFSSTQRFAAEFGAALGAADEVLVLDVSRAREKPVPGVSGALVADAVPLPAGRVRYVPATSEVAPALAELALPDDLVLTMGSGDVTLVGPELLALLGGRGRP
ncbi:UDP-N-acetylmuramate--L-alanine ligase [Streptomyces sp. MST-110588]|uniref:UDP-N-acetylmuramate--L-alanine ligase n=1 Tax=Streptomyces sp. MST-110588 TaxID=2833628 RepID=UPI001F5D146E|nr:UDP-N-acetylmuramate--L-alanine ligase [Streptomyces sp. MST-110588]UNO39185.1 UDP-N-acetylmuramate--L-alanine ligase [Streptomyces sp. MST-110588]